MELRYLKKLVGLYFLTLNDGLDKISIVIDCDTLCVEWDAGICDRVLTNYGRKTFFGVGVSDETTFYNINSVARDKILDNDDVQGCQIIKIYTWFFEMPMYKSSDVRRFFSHVSDRYGSVDGFFAALEYRSFEHIMFSLVLAKDGWTFLDYGEVTKTVPENLALGDFLRISQTYNYVPIWMNSASYFRSPDQARKSMNPYFLSHFDRFLA